MGMLSTHVIDVARGRPATGVGIELAFEEQAGWRRLKSVSTNQEGRTDVPLLEGDVLKAGCYELTFHVAGYFAVSNGDPGNLPFLDAIPVRFRIADPAAHYHVPLLVTPWGYSTYRGS